MMIMFKNQKAVATSQKKFGIIHKPRGGGSTYGICIRIALLLSDERNGNIEVVVHGLNQVPRYIEILKEELELHLLYNHLEHSLKYIHTGQIIIFRTYNKEQPRGRYIRNKFLTDLTIYELLNINEKINNPEQSVYIELEDEDDAIGYFKYEMEDNIFLNDDYKKIANDLKEFKRKEFKRFYLGDIDD